MENECFKDYYNHHCLFEEIFYDELKYLQDSGEDISDLTDDIEKEFHNTDEYARIFPNEHLKNTSSVATCNYYNGSNDYLLKEYEDRESFMQNNDFSHNNAYYYYGISKENEETKPSVQKDDSPHYKSFYYYGVSKDEWSNLRGDESNNSSGSSRNNETENALSENNSWEDSEGNNLLELDSSEESIEESIETTYSDDDIELEPTEDDEDPSRDYQGSTPQYLEIDNEGDENDEDDYLVRRRPVPQTQSALNEQYELEHPAKPFERKPSNAKTWRKNICHHLVAQETSSRSSTNQKPLINERMWAGKTIPLRVDGATKKDFIDLVSTSQDTVQSRMHSIGVKRKQIESLHPAPIKRQDPGTPTITCTINDEIIDNVLLDLGASDNIMPFSTYVFLGLGKFGPSNLELILGDGSTMKPIGEIKDVMVHIDKFCFPADFSIVDMPPVINHANHHPLVIGRPFLATCNAKINCLSGKMKISDGVTSIKLTIYNYRNPSRVVGTIPDNTASVHLRPGMIGKFVIN